MFFFCYPLFSLCSYPRLLPFVLIRSYESRADSDVPSSEPSFLLKSVKCYIGLSGPFHIADHYKWEAARKDVWPLNGTSAYLYHIQVYVATYICFWCLFLPASS